MTKLTLGSHPFLLGFDQLERLVERTAKAGNDGYPPYNIEQNGENAYRITLAVAGFAEDDLSITLEDRQLVIRGRQSDDGAERVFLRVALNEMSTLDGALRRIGESSQGFDANFVGLTRETAELACRRLQARGTTCFMIQPPS